MLFDLRSRGRRRAIRFIYAGLAILMGSGLVLFGVGGSVSGGLLDAFNSDSGTSNSKIFQERIDAAEKRVKAAPRNAPAWAALARARFQQAADEQVSGVYTDKGKQELATVQTAWDRYLALKPEKPDERLASLMVQAFGPGALEKYDDAVAAMEIVIEQRDQSTGLYVQYATLAYLAGQNRKGDLAGKKAVALAPKDLRTQVQAQLDSAKAQAAQAAAQQAQQQTTG